MGSPFAPGQHVSLVVLLDLAGAFRVAAQVVHPTEVGGVLEVLPLQHLHLATVRARYVVVALVALLEQVGNLRHALQGGRAGVVELRTAAEGGTACLGQLDGITLVVEVDLPAVHLIAVDVAGSQLGQVGGGAGSGAVQRPALELLRVHGVAGIARAGLGDSRLQLGHRVDVLADPAGDPLGQAEAGQQGQNVGRRHMDAAADPVQPDLGLHQLRGHHGDDALGRMGGRQAAHWLAGIRGAVGVVLAGLSGAGIARNPLVLIGPLVHPQLGVWLESPQVRRPVHGGTVGILVIHGSVRLLRVVLQPVVERDQLLGVLQDAAEHGGELALHLPGVGDVDQLTRHLGRQP
ncbi:hypothetical protein D9M70_357200 [compost metagenome]